MFCTCAFKLIIRKQDADPSAYKPTWIQALYISLRNDILHLSVENDYYYYDKEKHSHIYSNFFQYSNVFILWNVEFIFQKLLLASHNSNSHKTSWRPGILHVMNSYGCPKMSILWIVCASLQGLYCGAEVEKPFQAGQAESMNAVQDSSVWAISEQIIHSFVVCVRERGHRMFKNISFQPLKNHCWYVLISCLIVTSLTLIPPAHARLLQHIWVFKLTALWSAGTS